jgi:hypothetical protein
VKVKFWIGVEDGEKFWFEEFGLGLQYLAGFSTIIAY